MATPWPLGWRSRVLGTSKEQLEAIYPSTAQPGPAPRWVIVGGRCTQEPDPFLWFWAGYVTQYPPHLPWLLTAQERPWGTPPPLWVEGVKLSGPSQQAGHGL